MCTPFRTLSDEHTFTKSTQEPRTNFMRCYVFAYSLFELSPHFGMSVFWWIANGWQFIIFGCCCCTSIRAEIRHKFHWASIFRRTFLFVCWIYQRQLPYITAMNWDIFSSWVNYKICPCKDQWWVTLLASESTAPSAQWAMCAWIYFIYISVTNIQMRRQCQLCCRQGAILRFINLS